MFKTQVPKEHYYNQYDDLPRFISYYYQTDLVKQLNPTTVLEIGIGNKTTTNYLKQQGFNVTTCDFDQTLQPDYVADIRKLPFQNNKYDCVMACEILEHIPYQDIDKALNEIHRVTKKHAIISLPYSSAAFECTLRFPLIEKIFKKHFLNLFFRIPYFWIKPDTKGQHYWEIGRKGYPIKKIRNKLSEKFTIKKETRPTMDAYHHFFTLEKK